MPKAPGNTADQAVQPEADSVDSSSADAGAAAQEAPPANESNSLMTAQGSVQADAANGIAADEGRAPGRGAGNSGGYRGSFRPPHSSVWHRWKTV